MKGIQFIENFLAHHAGLFDFLKQNIQWDDRMKTRKTASFGVAYNYSQITYPEHPFPAEFESIIDKIESNLSYRPNNCLINYYLDGSSKMGWHSDQTDILEEGTGVTIISLGATRILRFREIEKKLNKIDFSLPSGSMIYMNQAVQDEWQHSIPKSNIAMGRMSLTFRKIV